MPVAWHTGGMTDDSGASEESAGEESVDDADSEATVGAVETKVDPDEVPGSDVPEGSAGGASADGQSPAETPSDDDGGTEVVDAETRIDDGEDEADGEGAGDVAGEPGDEDAEGDDVPGDGDVPEDVRKYERFKKVDGAQYERVNEFLRDRTYVTAREWAIARLCADFRTETGVEMTKVGENLPELVPFMTDTYTPQAVNQARASFEEKVKLAGATFLYGAMCDFFTAEELDEVMYEATEVAKFLLEVEGVDLAVEDELEAEDRISSVMREVREASEALRYEECPNCGHDLRE